MPPSSNSPLSGKKILIIHFRVGRTDGVSIEIDAWKEILIKTGAIVKLCSGPVNEGADYVISNLEQQLNPTIYDIDEAAYKRGVKDSEGRLTEAQKALERPGTGPSQSQGTSRNTPYRFLEEAELDHIQGKISNTRMRELREVLSYKGS